jgi:hypothetical protein
VSTKKESPFVFYRREWLNEPGEGTAFIEAEIRKPYRDDEFAYFDGGDITIKDCNRQISLSFPVNSFERRENSLAKIAQLLNVIENFQAMLLHIANKTEQQEAVQEEERKRLEEARKQRRSEGEGDECTCANCSPTLLLKSEDAQ